MEFADKLNYLFELTHAEGKELAAAMHLTPPQISKMRKGVRGLPRDREAAAVLARFFARRCAGDFQRDALARALRTAQLRTVTRESDLAGVLLAWLSDERSPGAPAAGGADGSPRQSGPSRGETAEEEGLPRETPADGESSFFAYYGGEGKRLAAQTFLTYLLQRRQPCTIDLLTDESIAWITDDPAYPKRLQASMVRLARQGCTFRRIAAPISDSAQALESLSRWLPLYTAGQAAPYYYKRMRDPLNRTTLFVVPGVAALFSFSVGGDPFRNAATFFTVDERTTRSMAAEFERYLELCEPMMNVYSAAGSLRRMHACMLSCEGYAGSCIQRSGSLSFITLPWDVAVSLPFRGRPEERGEFLSAFAQRHKRFQENLERHPFVDILRLETAEAVLRGAAAIPAAWVLSGEPQYYKPADYLLHLRGILYLLEHRKHYHVVLRRPEDADPALLYVKEGRCAILSRSGSPLSICEVSERHLVDAFAEYLRRLIPPEPGEQARKRAAAAEIRALIAALEQGLREAEPKA